MLIFFWMLLLQEKCQSKQFFSGPCFPVFRLNTEIFTVNIRIKSKRGKMRSVTNSGLHKCCHSCNFVFSFLEIIVNGRSLEICFLKSSRREETGVPNQWALWVNRDVEFIEVYLSFHMFRFKQFWFFFLGGGGRLQGIDNLEVPASCSWKCSDLNGCFFHQCCPVQVIYLGYW